MRQIIIPALLILMIGCKKKDKSIEPTPTPYVCETKTKVFEGYYETTNNSKDTIVIVFSHNNCPTEGVNTYSVYGLGKAFNNGTQASLNVNTVYEIVSNESAKSATTKGYNCKWGIGSGLSCDYNGVGVLYFKKL